MNIVILLIKIIKHWNKYDTNVLLAKKKSKSIRLSQKKGVSESTFIGKHFI